MEKLFSAQLPWFLTVIIAPLIRLGSTYAEALAAVERPLIETTLHPKKTLAALMAALRNAGDPNPEP